MANTDAPFGLRPIRHRNGAPYNGAFNHYYVASSYATALFVGDPVVKTGTSNTDRKSTRLNSQSRLHLVCRLLLDQKKTKHITHTHKLTITHYPS